MKKKLLVREANNLIEAKYKLDIWEARIFLSALAQIRPDDEDFKKYKIYVNDVIAEHNITSKAAHGLLKKAANTLRKKEITIPYEYEGEMLKLTTGLITAYGTKNDDEWEDNDGAYVIVDLHSDLKPYLLQLKAQFTQYNIAFLMQMQSGHSRRIYRLLKQYVKIGRRKLTIENLREILCIEKGEYKKYSHFKKRVLQKAQKDLETYSDLTFEFEEIKRGRKVREIIFIIHKKNSTEIEEQEQELVLEKVLPVQFPKLTEWGVTSSAIKKYLTTHKEEEIRHRIDYLKKLEGTAVGNKIKNWAGYFHKLMQESDFVTPDLVAQQQKEAQRQKKAILANKKTKLSRSIKNLSKSKGEAFKYLVGQIFEQELDLKALVVGLVKRRKYSGFDEKLSVEANLNQNSMFRGAIQAELAKQYPEQFAEIEENFAQQLKKLELELEALK